MAGAYTLIIDGTPMPAPKREGIVITDEKVWSANTGRTISGKMVGDIVAKKTTVRIDWTALSFEEAESIRRVVSDPDKPFHELSFTDLTGETTTMTVYFSNPAFTIFTSLHGGSVRNVSVSGIEQ